MGSNKVTVLLLVLWALAAVAVVHAAAAATAYEEESLVGGDGGGGRCNSTAECNGHGHCAASTTADLQQDSLLNSNATGVCHCDSRYAGKWCEHKRKNKLEAFLLSILIGTTGADRFYLGFIGLGVAKLLLNVLACVPACIGSCLGTCCSFARRKTEYVGIGDDYGEGLTCSSLFSIGGSCLACCMSLGSVAWWLTDWILILKGKRAGGLRRLQPGEHHVDGVQLELFARAVLEKAGCEVPSAEAVAWSLTEGSLRGVDSHGIRLLPHYVENLVHGGINGKPNMTWSSTYPALRVVLDADHAFGAAAGFKAIDIGIERAQQYGVAAVGVINSKYSPFCALWMSDLLSLAAVVGYLAFAFTNTGPKILSHNGKQPYFGTNPIAFACPRLEKEPFCLDMATSMIPWNKVEAARKTGKQLPEGTVADEEGNPTTDPHIASSLLAAGSYKGFGLAAMVELLCTALLGMAFGHHTVQMYGPTSDMSEKRRLGQFYLVARCDACVSLPQFLQAVQQMTNEVRSEPPKESAVMLPNDPETKVEAVRRQHGIPLDEVVLGELVALGRRFSVPFPPLLSSPSTAKL